MKLLDAINELAAAARIGRVTPDEAGGATLLFDGAHEVSFTPDEAEGALFQCEVGDAADLGSDGCRALLEASFADAGGAAFAIYRALGKVILWRRYGEFASRDAFEKAVNDFLGQAIAWKGRLAAGLGEDGAPAPSDADLLGLGLKV